MSDNEIFQDKGQIEATNPEPIREAAPKILTMHYHGFPVRWIPGEGGPWWVATDVCTYLGTQNVSQALTRLDDDEKMTICNPESHSGLRGGAQSLLVVNEPGLYRLVLSSRKPEAKAFQRWVTHEVLPSIRKTGTFDGRPKTFHELAREALELAGKEIRSLELWQSREMPKIQAYNRLLETQTTFDLTSMLRYLRIPDWDASALLRYLKGEGIVGVDKWDRLLEITPQYKDRCLFDTQVVDVGSHGMRRRYHKVVATLEGLQWLQERLEGEVKSLPTLGDVFARP